MPNRRKPSLFLTDAINVATHCSTCGELFTIALRPTNRRRAEQPEQIIIGCPQPNCEGTMEPLLYADVLGVWAGAVETAEPRA